MPKEPKRRFDATYILTVGERGRVAIPSEVRKRLDIEVGDNLVLRMGSNGYLELVDSKEAVRRMCGFMRRPEHEGRSIVDEFLADRRAEAANE